jgi:hypothetical protein
MIPHGTLRLDANVSLYSEERSNRHCSLAGEVGEQNITRDVPKIYLHRPPPLVDNSLIPFLIMSSSTTTPSNESTASTAVENGTANVSAPITNGKATTNGSSATKDDTTNGTEGLKASGGPKTNGTTNGSTTTETEIGPKGTLLGPPGSNGSLSGATKATDDTEPR